MLRIKARATTYIAAVQTSPQQHSFALMYTEEPAKLSWHSDLLWAGQSWDRIPVRARLSAPVQTGSKTHPVSYIMATRSFPGVKQLECGTDHPPPSSTEIKERVELYLYSPSGPLWPVLG
jgi:hypothetical protein